MGIRIVREIIIELIAGMRARGCENSVHSIMLAQKGFSKNGQVVFAVTLYRIFFASATAMRVKNMNSGRIMAAGNSGITHNNEYG